eukprot:320307_1
MGQIASKPKPTMLIFKQQNLLLHGYIRQFSQFLGQNVQFPNFIQNEIKNLCINNEIIFECGGWDGTKYRTECNALLRSTKNNKSYSVELPSFPKTQNWDYNGPNSLYDTEKGLFCIGGLNMSYCFNLKFNNKYNKHNWEWLSLPGLQVRRQWPSCIMIDTMEIENKKKILAVAGYFGSFYNTVEIFDFKQNSWSYVKSTNIGREKAGIYYERQKQNVYIAGGWNPNKIAQFSVECYDIGKNEWIKMQRTTMHHRYFPVLFMDDNILYVMSNREKENIVEYMDIRTNKWQKTSFAIP